MSIDISTVTFNQLVWIVLILLGLGVIFVLVRFFHHILKHLVQGFAFILMVLAALALLHYFRVF